LTGQPSVPYAGIVDKESLNTMEERHRMEEHIEALRVLIDWYRDNWQTEGMSPATSLELLGEQIRYDVRAIHQELQVVCVPDPLQPGTALLAIRLGDDHSNQLTVQVHQGQVVGCCEGFGCEASWVSEAPAQIPPH
jgi:hypothetical protein